MQSPTLPRRSAPLFMEKTGSAVTPSRQRAVLTAALLQRFASRTAPGSAVPSGRGEGPCTLVASWLAQDRPQHDPALAPPCGPTIRPHDAQRSKPVPNGTRTDRLRTQLQRLARALTDDDLALSIGQMRVLVRARRRAAAAAGDGSDRHRA